MVYIKQNFRQHTSRTRLEQSDPARVLSKILLDIYHCYVYSENLLMMDRGTLRHM